MLGLLSAGDLSRERVDRLLAAAARHDAGHPPPHRDARVLLLFFQDSLRTRIGFEVAAAHLGATTSVVSAPKQSAAMGSPETLADTVRSVGHWFDAVCVRHPDDDGPAEVARLLETPVINCGNGSGEHPTQALVDLFALMRLRGRIDGLRIGLVGDLRAMRTAHSLALALALCRDVTVRCIAPAGLELPAQYAAPLVAAGHRLESTTALEVDGLDALYVAGLPAETAIGVLSRDVQTLYRVTPSVVDRLEPDALVLSPLPRVDEISAEVDELPQAAYFAQSRLAVSMRVAVLDEALSLRSVGSSDGPR